MKPAVLSMMLLALCLLAGCASPYMIDRGRDAADVFTATVDKGIGFKARVGPFAGGLGTSASSKGLRGGTLIDQKNHWCGNAITTWDLSVILFNSEYCSNDKMEVRGKEISGGSKVLPPNSPWSKDFLPFIQLSNVHNPAYYTDIEFWFGFIYSFRLGFNPGELLDFLLGWTTLDIYGDDIGLPEEKFKNLEFSDSPNTDKAMEIDAIEGEKKMRNKLKRDIENRRGPVIEH